MHFCPPIYRAHVLPQPKSTKPIWTWRPLRKSKCTLWCIARPHCSWMRGISIVNVFSCKKIKYFYFYYFVFHVPRFYQNKQIQIYIFTFLSRIHRYSVFRFSFVRFLMFFSTVSLCFLWLMAFASSVQRKETFLSYSLHCHIFPPNFFFALSNHPIYIYNIYLSI